MPLISSDVGNRDHKIESNYLILGRRETKAMLSFLGLEVDEAWSCVDIYSTMQYAADAEMDSDSCDFWPIDSAHTS